MPAREICIWAPYVLHSPTDAEVCLEEIHADCLANLKEVEKRYEKMGFPANKLESKILPKIGDSNNNPSSAEDAISTDAKKEKDNVSIEET